ncbi:MAG TPA: molecular chaperone DnaK, partial [Candidatus Binatia bacterium]|nr:molecular chaperone DnaK [Candidatus Binatia bacterium]
FFPLVAAGETPRPRPAVALAEFGLPYASEPEIPRHLAEFLARAAVAAGGEAIAPDAVLFNGGALKPRAIRERILDQLAAWAGDRPRELAGTDLDLAVARGAAAYGLALRGAGVRIGGGAARAYYVGVASGTTEAGATLKGGGASGTIRVLCIAPRGMEDGDSVEIATPEFEVLANAPVRFPIYAASARAEEPGGALVDADPATLVELPPIATVLRFGRSLQARAVRVHLRSQLTATGTLELWCHARDTTHRWRMGFDLRSAPASAPEAASAIAAADDADGETDAAGSALRPPASEVVIEPERVAAARALIEACFGASGGPDPVRLGRDLEEALGCGKDAWPLAAIRELWDALVALEPARARSPAHEARWLNLVGFLLRPGVGEARDAWRVEQVWRLFDRGLQSPGATQARAEWWTLWKRVASGLTRQQQQALHQEIRPVLLPDARKKGKPSRWKGGPQEVREMWQVAGALERLPAGTKLEMLRALAPRVVADRASDAELWAFGRLAARAPLYGPANAVVEPSAVEPWLADLAARPWPRAAATALAVAQVARLTGDRVRDVGPELREKLASRLESEPEGRRLARWLRERVAMDVRDQALVLAESLPIGLRVADVAADSAPAA